MNHRDDHLEDLHEYISFEDPDEYRTWVFDVTFLLSPWTCIYGRGCPGVLTSPAPELEQGCCSYGAHFVDDDDHAETLAYIERLTDEQWQFRRRASKEGATRRTRSGQWVTRVHQGACIMLNRPEFPGVRAARSTGPRSRPVTDRSTGSPTCAGSSPCASRRPPTTTAT